MIRHKIESLNIRDRYMIGDIVLCDGKPYQWTGDDYLRSQKGMELIQPIRLTEEVLKVNGFDSHTLQYEDDHVVFLNEATGHLLIYSLIFGKNKPNIDVTIEYIHELQHALRLCGLNELADKFKIQ